MTVDQLSEGTILVTLERRDMERYELDFSRGDTADARRGLTRLLCHVGEECDLGAGENSYLIEALPAGDSALLIISVRAPRPRRRWRIKRERRYEVCIFADSDALIALDPGRLRIGYALYRCEDGWRLIPDRPLSARLTALLSEYAAVRTVTAVELARVREYGVPVSVREAPRRRPGATGSLSSGAVCKAD